MHIHIHIYIYMYFDAYAHGTLLEGRGPAQALEFQGLTQFRVHGLGVFPGDGLQNFGRVYLEVHR